MQSTQLPSTLQTSWDTVSGRFLSACSRTQFLGKGEGLSTLLKIAAYAARFFVVYIPLIACIAIDLTFWTLRSVGMLISLIPICCGNYIMQRARVISHLKDLVSTVALPVIGLGYLLANQLPPSDRPGTRHSSDCSFDCQPNPERCYVIKNRAGGIYSFDREGLFRAAQDNRSQLIEQFHHRGITWQMEKNSENPEEPPFSPLMEACRSESYESVEMFLRLGATLSEAQIKKTVDCLLRHKDKFQASDKALEILKLLIEKQAIDPFVPLRGSLNPQLSLFEEFLLSNEWYNRAVRHEIIHVCCNLKGFLELSFVEFKTFYDVVLTWNNPRDDLWAEIRTVKEEDPICQNRYLIIARNYALRNTNLNKLKSNLREVNEEFQKRRDGMAEQLKSETPLPPGILNIVLES